MKLSKKEVENIARLARLRLTPKEINQYSGQLSAILDYVKKMNEVDTEKVEPTSQVTGLTNVTREDNLPADGRKSGIAKELIDSAPEHYGGQIKVPDILGKK